MLGAAAATLTVWAIAGPLVGVDLRVHVGSGTQHVGPATVVAVSVLTGLAAWALLAALEHFSPRAPTIWTAIALAALALSLAAAHQRRHHGGENGADGHAPGRRRGPRPCADRQQGAGAHDIPAGIAEYQAGIAPLTPC